MKRAIGTTIAIAGAVQLISTARVLGIAVVFRWIPLELKDGRAARLSVEAALAAEAEMISG